MTPLTYATPLEWPLGWPRKQGYRGQSHFQVSLSIAVDELTAELERLGAMLPILSSNLEFRRDGLLRARQFTDDPGVAVYFHLNGEARVMPCDEFTSVRENVRAIGKTIEALRGIERWGGLTLQGKAFEGFKALPSGERPWWQVLDVKPSATEREIRHARDRLALIFHPDLPGGGDTARMKEVNAAYQAALKALQGRY